MAEILREVENSLNTINEYYRKILMLTGSDPDEYRDYNFQRIMPDVLRGLVQQADALYAVSDRLAEITGGKGEHSATLDKIALIVEYMGKYPDTIAARLSSLKDQLAGARLVADLDAEPAARSGLHLPAGARHRTAGGRGRLLRIRLGRNQEVHYVVLLRL